MSMLERPGLKRIKELYDSGAYQKDIAEDPEIRRTILAGIDNPVSRKWKIFHTINSMAEMGIIVKREPNNMKAPSVGPSAIEESHKATSKREERWHEEHLQQYEKFIAAKAVRRQKPVSNKSGRQETVIISDLHIPDERMDLLEEVCHRHKGARCCLAGDVNDFEVFGRFDVKDWNTPHLKSALARTDVVFGLLADNFSEVSVLFGNHDLRLARKASKALGPDYHFICQTFLMWAYERRHGIKVVQHNITKTNGRDLPGLFFYEQIGDCLVGHVEAAGRPVGKGSLMAHDFFYSYRDHLGLKPFKVVVQAHTHKQSYFRHYLTGVHCFEIGCLCDIPAYSMNQPKYSPVQHGYYHLVQYNGVTDVNESRMVFLD